jgi:hypothetical protein
MTEARKSGFALKKFNLRNKSHLKSKLHLKKSALRENLKAKQDDEPAEPIDRELEDVSHNHHHMLDEFLDVYKGHRMSFGEIKLVF